MKLKDFIDILGENDVEKCNLSLNSKEKLNVKNFNNYQNYEITLIYFYDNEISISLKEQSDETGNIND